MNATDELRHMLTELGVKYVAKDRPMADHSDWKAWVHGDVHQPSGAMRHETLWNMSTDGEQNVYNAKATEVNGELYRTGAAASLNLTQGAYTLGCLSGRAAERERALFIGKQAREERNPQPLEEMLHLAKVIRILRFTKAGCLLIPVRAGCPDAPDDLHSPGSR